MHRGMKLLHLMTSTNVIDSRAADREGPRICLPQDYAKALELWKQSGELGHTKSYSNIGCAYYAHCRGVERDEKKAEYYYELAAMGGM